METEKYPERTSFRTRVQVSGNTGFNPGKVLFGLRECGAKFGHLHTYASRTCVHRIARCKRPLATPPAVLIDPRRSGHLRITLRTLSPAAGASGGLPRLACFRQLQPQKSGQNEKNRSQNAQNERSRHFHKKAELTMSSYNSGAQPAYAKVVRLARIENPISTTIRSKLNVKSFWPNVN